MRILIGYASRFGSTRDIVERIARLIFKALGGHAGDNRAWSDIDAWAAEIALAFARP